MVQIASDFGTNDPDNPNLRHIRLTPASAIKPRRVRWLWKDRIAYGTLSLLAGREGLGKSTLGYKLAADVTRGTLEGEDHGNPRAVLVCASEDSWEHTIVPRLIAAQANLDMVYRVEMVRTFDELRMTLSLPRDFSETRAAAEETGAGLMILDPLMSVIDSRLDTHRDREVREALEPLAGLADEARMAIVGLIHHNKSGSTDALQLVMGSKAFSAVARSVHTCIPDPDDETQTRKLFATSKNNLGRLDLPVLGFTITSHAVETDDDGTAWTGRLQWTGEVEGSMHEIMTRTADPERGATAEAAQWLSDYLTSVGGEAAKVDVEKAGRVAGHAPRTLQRARERLRLEVTSYGFPRRTHWVIPGSQVDHSDHTEQTHPAPALVPDPDGLDEVYGAPSEAPETDADQALEGLDIGTTGPASGASAVVPLTPPGDSRAKSRQPVAPLGTTGPDLQKREEDPNSLARARTRGDTHLAQLEDLAQQHPPVVPVVPVVPGATRPRATPDHEPYAAVAGVDPTLHGDPWTPAFPGQRPPFQPGNRHGIAPDSDQPAPLCPDCGWPIDTTQHATHCEEHP